MIQFGVYQVRNDGKVYKRGKLVKPWIHKGRRSKYLRVSLTLNGKRIGYRVHRLVAQLYIPNPMNKPEVDHIDGNTFNNHVDNLRWVTSQENKLNRRSK